MLQAIVGPTMVGLEGIVNEFEAEWIVRGDAELADFLPEVGHRDRSAILLGLINVDLELRRASGRPRRLEDYLREYPELERLDLGELALNEFRLRRESGERVSIEDYGRRYGIETGGWPSEDPRDLGPRKNSISRLARFEATAEGRREGLATAARSYLDFRLDNNKGAAETIDAWAARRASSDDAETVDVLADLHRSDPENASKVAAGVVSLPEPGDTFLGFRLIDELGRGAFGRVYLASQGDLADRPVALKVSAERPTESQTLAQLQHTNIVPIFSAHRGDTLHAVCMPYFGSTTLKDVFEELEDQPSLPTSGQGLLKTLATHSKGVASSVRPSSVPSAASSRPGPGSTDGPGAIPVDSLPAPRLSSDTLMMLGRLSYVQAILWMGSRLADGLAHAHARGILHRDLKPANILLTDDGQPMLLDFNLSEDTKQPASVAAFGGTLPYMAPEHLKAFRGCPSTVDARSDIYALGIILYELLAGRTPFESYSGHSSSVLARMIAERSKPAPGLRACNPQVSLAVESIVRHCLEPDPDRRYQSATDLHEDLERHMANLPLRHAPEPSTKERAAKWARRHPRLASSTSMAILAGFFIFGLFAALLVRNQRLARLEANDALARFRDEAPAVRYRLNTRVYDADRRAGAVRLGRAALGPYGTLLDPDWRDKPLVTCLAPEDRRALLEEVGVILFFLARAGRIDLEVDARKPDDPSRKGDALAAARLCELADGCFEVDRRPRVLVELRGALTRLAGLEAEGVRLLDEAARLPLRTALDHELAATSMALKGEFLKALPIAREATRLDPRDFWGWLTLGFCHSRLGEDAEAAACFGTCIALRPDSPYGWYNRGEVHLRRADPEQARLDFDRASKLDPNWPEPFAERAVAEARSGRPADAVRDFTRAIELGATDTRIYFLRADARAKAGDPEGARLDRAEGLRREPSSDQGWVARAMSRPADDQAKALEDLDRALAINPRSLEALQGKAYVLAEKMGRIEDAAVVLDRAVAGYPDYVPTRSARGVLRAILGRRDAAHLDARESLWRDTSPRILYQAAGIYAVTSKLVPEDRVEAYRLLSTALRKGFGFEELAEDRELDPIRDQPEFRKLLEAARALQDVGPGANPRP